MPTKQEGFLLVNPAFAAALECLNAHPEVHARNTFAHDVVSKFHRFGSLSATQVSALTKSLQRDHEREHERAAEASVPKGLAPVGRQTVTGEVLGVKEKASAYGVALKLLVRLPNFSKVWVTAPKDRTVVKGDVVTFTATFEPSKDDPSFAFGSRPEYIGSTSGAPAPLVTPLPVTATSSHPLAGLDVPGTPAPPRAPAAPAKRSVLEELLEGLEEAV
jgi:hypothetical protein